MKTKFTLLYILLLSGPSLFAQTRFVTSGTIAYDKIINIFALMNKELNNGRDKTFTQLGYDQYIKNHQQIQSLKSALVFGDNKTLFTPTPPPDNEYGYLIFDLPMAKQNNTTYVDINNSTRVSQRKVFGENFLVKDSVNKIKWKITDETRDILGYSCRRANGLMLDSVYVVAFYTDQIPVSGGPESFTGLPGMILQVALPHESISWVATKITDATIPAAQLLPPDKGKTYTGKTFKTTLNSLLKNRVNSGQDYLKALQL
jgi:GLPGLI family protein